VVGGCGVGAAPASDVAASVGPEASVPPDIAATAAQLRSALGADSLQLTVPQVPFRPAESPMLAAAPRAVYQVKLPADQEHGFIVVYGFPSPAAATAAAQEQVAYVESGPGRVQFPADARFVLRQVGSTLVFHSWAPSAVTDPDAARIADVLASIGIPYPIRG
jgi:hypothetical protein